MKTITVLLFLIPSIILNAQINETNASLYTWKGKKTVSAPGFVVLNSGKKLEGEIILKGSSAEVTGLVFTGEGKTVDFPMTALKSYGLNVGGGTQAGVTGRSNGKLQCDHNEDLFRWRDQGEVMGKQLQNTKPRTGYVIKRDGTKIEGTLQIKKVDGVISEFKITGESGKYKLPSAEIARYGLMMTIAELTKNGEKVYKDAARNFNQGQINLKDGKTLNGLVAFKDRTYINPNKPGAGYKYNGLYFSEDKTSLVKTFSAGEVNFIVQSIEGKDLKYSPYSGGFVAENAMDNARYRDVLKQFNIGTLILQDGTTLKGKISKASPKSVNYKSDNGTITQYSADKVKRFDVTVENEQKSVVNIENILTEEYFNGQTFQVYINPKPTTINQKRTDLAQSATGLISSGAAAAVVNQDEKKQGYESTVDSLILYGTLEELKEFQMALVKLNGYNSSEELQNNSSNETAKKYDAALSLAILGKENKESIVVYYEEVILMNKTTGETYVLIKEKDTMNARLEGY